MAGIFGSIENPTNYASEQGSGLFSLISNILILAGTVAGIFFVIQIILAGFGYISAGGEPEKVKAAWTKIWQSIIGLLIVASAFIIAALIGRIFGIDPLAPEIVGPNG